MSAFLGREGHHVVVFRADAMHTTTGHMLLLHTVCQPPGRTCPQAIAERRCRAATRSDRWCTYRSPSHGSRTPVQANNHRLHTQIDRHSQIMHLWAAVRAAVQHSAPGLWPLIAATTGLLNVYSARYVSCTCVQNVRRRSSVGLYISMMSCTERRHEGVELPVHCRGTYKPRRKHAVVGGCQHGTLEGAVTALVDDAMEFSFQVRNII